MRVFMKKREEYKDASMSWFLYLGLLYRPLASTLIIYFLPPTAIAPP